MILKFEEKFANIPQEELMKMIDDCSEALTVQNCPFTAWEKDFLMSVIKRHLIYGMKANFTGRQQFYIKQAWEKI